MCYFLTGLPVCRVVKVAEVGDKNKSRKEKGFRPASSIYALVWRTPLFYKAFYLQAVMPASFPTEPFLSTSLLPSLPPGFLPFLPFLSYVYIHLAHYLLSFYFYFYLFLLLVPDNIVGRVSKILLSWSLLSSRRD